MDVSFLGGPQPQRGVGIVAPFDFALDRELWRWVPDDVSLHLTRTPFVPVEVSLDMARLVSEHETLREAVRALCAVAPEVVAYACTSGSFVGGNAGERGMSAAMAQAGEVPAVTTSGAMLAALREIEAERIAIVTPYTKSVTDALEDYLAEAGIAVTGRSYLGLTREIWRVPYREVVDMAREAIVDSPDALFISCTNLPTYDVIPQLEAELRMPVLSANQVTVWAALRRIGKDAVGPYQALLDPVARRGPAAMAQAPESEESTEEVSEAVNAEFDAAEFTTGELGTGEFTTGEFTAGELAAGEFRTTEFGTGEFASAEFTAAEPEAALAGAGTEGHDSLEGPDSGHTGAGYPDEWGGTQPPV